MTLITTERFMRLREQSLHMSFTQALVLELASGPWPLGIVLLFLGLLTVKPLITMSGAVIVVGAIAILVKDVD